MDDVVEVVFLLLEDVVKGTRCDDVPHKHKFDFFCPFGMEIQDLLRFSFRSNACGDPVSKLYKFYDQ
jgi:hypothetical protein